MGKYVEQNLNKNEKLIKKAELSWVPVVVKTVWVLLFIGIYIFLSVQINKYAVPEKTEEEKRQEQMQQEIENIMGSYGITDSSTSNSVSNVAEEVVDVAKQAFWRATGPFLKNMTLYAIVITGIIALGGVINHFTTEFAYTDKRLIGKVGVIGTTSMDAPLNKIQSVNVESGLFGKIFNYGSLRVVTAGADKYRFKFIKDCDVLKSAIMAQIEEYEQEQIAANAQAQAQQMAAMMGNMNNNSGNQ